MKITFIHHSCFCVEIEDIVLIFDYFKGDRIPEFSFQGKIPEYPKDQRIYVFSSHQHRDHFDMEIFTWQERYKNIRYILPKEIKLGDNYLTRYGIDFSVRERVTYMKANSSVELEGLQIETFLSTDEGVAFLVTYQGKNVYHAGDLHWWHWEGEDEVFLQYQEKTFKRQIEKLKDRKLDVAFVVIDQRLGEAVFWGIDYFMSHVKADYVIPMHLWQNYDLIRQFKELPGSEGNQEHILMVDRENQLFEL